MSSFSDLHALVRQDILAKLASRPLTCTCDMRQVGGRMQVDLCAYHQGMEKGVDDALEWEEAQ